MIEEMADPPEKMFSLREELNNVRNPTQTVRGMASLFSQQLHAHPQHLLTKKEDLTEKRYS